MDMLVLVMCMAGLGWQFASATKSAQQIVLMADEARGPRGAFSMTAKVHDMQDGDSKDSVFKISSLEKKFALIEQLEPPRQQGRKLLMREYDLWMFTANISRPTRISFEQRLTGEVSNGDLARTNFAEDYEATLQGEEKLAGQLCYKLALVARNKNVTYRKVVYWVSKDLKFPLQAEFYALSGKKLKTATYSEFKLVLGKKRMTKVTIVDALQKSRSSVLVFAKHKAEKFDEAVFSKEALGN